MAERVALLAVVLAGVAAAALLIGGDEDAPPAERPRDPRAALAGVERATVLVTTRIDDAETSNGSGWVVDARRGLVVTVAHVINFQPRPGRFEAYVRAGGRTRRATVVGVAPCEDLALLSVRDRSGLGELPLGSQAGLRRGDVIVAGGYPDAPRRARNLVTRRATVVRPRATAEGPFGLASTPLPNVIQVEGGFAVGTSGGPAVDMRGRVVGVVALRGAEGGNRRTYAIGADRVRAVIGALERGEPAGWLGKSFGFLWRPAPGQRPGIVLTADLSRSPDLPAGAVMVERVGGRPPGVGVAGYCRAAASLSGSDNARVRVRTARVSARGDYAASPAAPKREIRVASGQSGP